MQLEFLSRLRCPRSGQPLSLESGAGTQSASGGIDSGWLVSADGKHRYPIRGGIPRFVPESNYANSFGMQWNTFRQIQLDSYSGHNISANRFWSSTGWRAPDIRGQWVLDAGCGAGRFAEIALHAGAKVIALDYSNAVDACYTNLSHHPNFHAVQGDIYAPPFPKSFFAYVYSLGVLQHTPNVEKAFQALATQLRPGGYLAVDVYPLLWRNLFWSKYWIRPITTRMRPAMLMHLVEQSVPTLLKLSKSISRIPLIGPKLKYVVPVANYDGVYGLSETQLKDWAILDTNDMLSPAHDHPSSQRTLKTLFAEAGFGEIEVFRAGHLIGRGRMPGTPT